MKPKVKKLCTGIFLLWSFHFLCENLGGADGLEEIEKTVTSFLNCVLNYELSEWLSTIICLPLPVYMVYAAVSGTYRMCTFNQYIPVFEDKIAGGIVVRGHEVYPNINRVLNYRESKLSGLSLDEGANLYIASSKLESLYTGYENGPETQRTLSYIESKLSGMSSDRALNYLSNKL